MNYLKSFVFFLSIFMFTLQVNAGCIVNRNLDIEIIKPDSLYIDHGNGTVTDKVTGLMWQKCSLGLSGSNCATGSASTHTWQAALAVANQNTGSGHTEWRLPNMKELETLVEIACDRPAINQTIFPATISERYWSSTPNVSNVFSHHARGVIFTYGDSTSFLKKNARYVRLVRGG